MKKDKQLTPEEQELLRAYNRKKAQEYREKHPDRVRQYRQNYALRKAREELAAGLLDIPGKSSAPAAAPEDPGTVPAIQQHTRRADP